MLHIFEVEGGLLISLNWSKIHAKKGEKDYQSYPGSDFGYSFAGLGS